MTDNNNNNLVQLEKHDTFDEWRIKINERLHANAAIESQKAAKISETNAKASEIEAVASANIASSSADTAVNAMNDALAARDAAIVNADVYPDEETGRAAVADGEYFKVIGGGDVAVHEYHRTNESTSELITSYPSVDYVTNSRDVNFGILSPLDSANVNFDTKNNQLILSGTIRIITPTREFVVPASTIPLPTPTSITLYRVEYDISTSSFSIPLADTALTPENIILGWIRRLSNGDITVYGIDSYVVNGVSDVDALSYALEALNIATMLARYGDGPYPTLDLQFAGATMLPHNQLTHKWRP